MFLTLTPSKQHHKENGIKSGSMDSVSLNVAVQPHTNGVVAEDVSQSLANGLTVVPVHTSLSPDNKHGAIVSSAEIVEPEAKTPEAKTPKTGPTIPQNSMLVETVRSPNTESQIEFPILSPGKDSFQDTVATKTIAQETATADDLVLPATRLKRQLENTKDLIVCPGVYDGFSARIALSVGFDALYMTGAGTTASRLGQPDLGLAQLSDMRLQADMICNLDPWGTPVIADMDTGYGGPNTIALAVSQYIRANVAGFHIEDQVLTKRCGHLAGKKVVSADVYFSRIRAAKAAKDRLKSDIVLIARTDANQQLGYDECIARLRVAAGLGADVGLLEGFKSKEQAARAVKDLAPFPLLLNIVENGHSPLITVEEAKEMGFRIMIFSIAGLAPALGAIKGAYERLKAEGVTGVQGTGVSPIKIFEMCGLKECMRIDEEAGGEDFKGGV
ncbi:hypothetical protein ACLMJK_005653 [Lecanora helva]